jgi:hypothetical protein
MTTLDYRYSEENGPMTPAHAGGAIGELDAAFVLGQRGFGIAIGPGGPGGHRLTATGFDIVAYNPATDQLWIVDNKASGGTSTVQSASAITTNLEANLTQSIQQIRRAHGFPHQQTIIRNLENALDAVRAGRPLPSNVERYVTNAGGYHGGISRKLQDQGVKFLDITGSATRDTRKGDISTARKRGMPPGRPTTHQGRRAGGGVVTPPSGSGGARAAGLTVALAGLNFALNWLNDREQQRRVQEALARIEQAIEVERRRRPDHGILIFVYYHKVQAPPESLLQPGAVFSHIAWESGRTRDEALEAYSRRSTISPGPPRGSLQHVSRMWIQPTQPPSISSLQTPFPQTGFGIFAVNGAKLQDVEWGGLTGFDDEGQTTLRLPSSPTPRFILLRPPASINWVYGGRIHTTSIPIVQRRAAVGQRTLEAVNLDPRNPFGNVAAVPVFPYDSFTERLFRSGRPTRDNLNHLRLYPNIRHMRWVRPENVSMIG